eukprot:SAG22_NODE_3541_length_1652_cov_1.383129_2_plen_317_part_00
MKGSDHCLSLCFSAFPCGFTALTSDRCNQLGGLGFTKAVRHIAKFSAGGEPTYQLKGNALYADAFESKPAPAAFQTWRGGELAARLASIADGTVEAEGPLLPPRASAPAPAAAGSGFPPSALAARVLSGTQWKAAGGWRDASGWVYGLDVSFEQLQPAAMGTAGPGTLAGVASWTLQTVPDAHAAAYGAKVGQADTERLSGAVNASQLALDGDPADTPDIAPSSFRLVLCEPESAHTVEPDDDGVLAEQQAALAAVTEADDGSYDGLPAAEKAALHAELRGNISGAKVRLVRVAALPPAPTMSAVDVTGNTPRAEP